MLVGVGGILNGQWMQIKLPLHPLQKIVTRFDQTDPHDTTGSFRPLTSLLDWDVGDFPAAGINGCIDDAGPVGRSLNRQFGFGQHGRTSRRSCGRYGRIGPPLIESRFTPLPPSKFALFRADPSLLHLPHTTVMCSAPLRRLAPPRRVVTCEAAAEYN
jgi:hypothetical protein